MKRLLILIAMLTAVSAHCMTGDQLLEILDSGPMGKANVTGFVGGIYEAELDETICNQKPVAYGEMRDAIIDSMRRNPQLNKNNAGKLVHGNLLRMFPCPKLKGAI